ncbi:MAG: hypothetical protein Q7K43_00855 [Candidatus Woesearchaeota archaeon]|nr:hypothetical protein [Candidatus Woesearchaeota archaeon]
MVFPIPKSAVVIELTSSAEHIKGVLQKRLAFVETTVGVPTGSLVQITDEAFSAISKLTQNNVGFSLEVLKKLMPSKAPDKLPYIITADHVAKTGFTYEFLVERWDSPYRTACLIELPEY